MSRRRGVQAGIGLLVGALSGAGGPLGAEEARAPMTAAERFGPLALLEGTWQGEISGKLGTGKGVRSYELIMGGQYMVSRHESVRLPQEKSPEGDHHQELAVFSFDSERKAVVYREFMVEGVVVRSLCTIEETKVVCVSEAVESGPGIRARLTLEIQNRYRFTEIYEIGWPGQELGHYFTNRWTRASLPFDWE